MFLKNKKGNFSDIATTIEFVLAFAIVGIFVLIFLSHWNTHVQGMSSDIVPNITKEGLDSLNTALPSFMDIFFVAILLIFFIFSIVMARLIPSSPHFYIISFFSIIIFIFAGIVVENVWTGIVSNTTIASTVADLKYLPFILNNMIYFLLFYAVAIAIALLSKEN